MSKCRKGGKERHVGKLSVKVRFRIFEVWGEVPASKPCCFCECNTTFARLMTPVQQPYRSWQRAGQGVGTLPVQSQRRGDAPRPRHRGPGRLPSLPLAASGCVACFFPRGRTFPGPTRAHAASRQIPVWSVSLGRKGGFPSSSRSAGLGLGDAEGRERWLNKGHMCMTLPLKLQSNRKKIFPRVFSCIALVQ